MKSNDKIYFPGLNGLRFIAASLVIFHHVEQYKFWSGRANLWGNPIINSLGHQSVSFFFVLSGFLITYLLLIEHKNTGNVSLRNFYWRRVVRIWPLYFVIVALALSLAPIFGNFGFVNIDTGITTTTVVSLLLFVPNLLRIINPTLVGANQLWSVGIEEQFYAIWPILVRLFARNISKFLVVFVIIKALVHGMLLIGISSIDGQWVLQLEKLYTLFPVEQMAIGGLGAAMLFHNQTRIINFVMNKWILGITLALLILSSLSEIHFFLGSYFDAILFTVILIHVIRTPAIYRPLETPRLIKLGNISYGIYMWHTLVISFVLGLYNRMEIVDGLLMDISLYVICFGLTVVLAHFSFNFLERPFLKLKHTFPGLFTKHKNALVNR